MADGKGIQHVKILLHNSTSTSAWGFRTRAEQWACKTKQKATTNNEKSAQTQTLHAGCSKTDPKIFRPTAYPLPGGTGLPKFN